VKKRGRRAFLKTSGGAVAGLGSLLSTELPLSKAASPEQVLAPGFKLGMVTYELGKNWDIETIIKNCEIAGFEAVELRTTHKHGVELSLGKDKRTDVRKRFEGSRVRLLSLGTTCEFQYAQKALVERNIEETYRWCELAHDLGCLGVKVRPNGFVKDVPKEKTLEQIGQALQKCGDAARDQGVEIWVEVHGQGTEDPPNIQRIMEVANHPSVGICWNCNDTDVVDGSVKESFELLKPWLRSCHINELWRNPSPRRTAMGQSQDQANPGFPAYDKPYPFRELFRLMRAAGYTRYTLAEVPESCEPLRFMRYYRSLWEQLAA
jgi:sugar phosphate isomerase/epimerase